MRPQHLAADNAGDGYFEDVGSAASMRPQHLAADNSAKTETPETHSPCFNEAAAFSCG